MGVGTRWGEMANSPTHMKDIELVTGCVFECFEGVESKLGKPRLAIGTQSKSNWEWNLFGINDTLCTLRETNIDI